VLVLPEVVKCTTFYTENQIPDLFCCDLEIRFERKSVPRLKAVFTYSLLVNKQIIQTKKMIVL